ncbi:MAG: hypothetical protein EZS28_006581 [Streblomastix strix]|uniref:Uncharacterized protein n=1 Tax=Streblomastix strix TaxID=222440 RepID=A0A5J4WS18_9EUKA|nr:MAG: hypothetical protein EZS28_006581 [Streblomastix strix]
MTDIESYMNIIECEQSYCRNPLDNTSKILNYSFKHSILTQLSTKIHIYFSILHNTFRTIACGYNQPFVYFILTMILILLRSFWKSCFIHLLSFNRKSSINHNHQKNKNNNHFIHLILLIFFLQNNLFDASGDEFYVSTTGYDANLCTQTEHCRTLEALYLKDTVNNATEYTLYIMNTTTISSPFTIYSSQTLPRTFTNNPSNGTTQSEIQLLNDGYFSISGNTLFQYIKFTIQDGVSNLNGRAIYASFTQSSRILEIASCSFVGFQTNGNGGAIFIEFISVGEALLRNLQFSQCRSNQYRDSGGGIYFSNLNQGETIFRYLSFNQCQAYNSGGALFAHLESGGKLTISGSCLFTDCNTATDYYGTGGGIYASINGENSQLIIEDSMQFERCSGLIGGGMCVDISDLGKFNMTGSGTFIECNSTQYGGGCYIRANQSNYEILLLGNIQFERCATEISGGGLYIYGQDPGQVTINGLTISACNSLDDGGGFYSRFDTGIHMNITGKITIDNCNSTGSGGGQFLYIGGFNSVLYITGKITIDNCNSTGSGGGQFLYIGGFNSVLYISGKITIDNCNSTGSGGGQFLYIGGPNSTLSITGELEYEQCQSVNGGGLYADLRNNNVIEINRASFKHCSSQEFGGGLYLNLSTDTQFTLYGTASFTDCNSSTGGGIYLEADGANVNFIPNEQILIDSCIGESIGGGIACFISNYGILNMNNMKFIRCMTEDIFGGFYNLAPPSGGGLFALNANGGQLTLDKSCEFYQCQSGLGGGIFILIDYASQSSFLIKDAFIHECKALNSTNSSLEYPESGFGGGLFLGGVQLLVGPGDYDPNSKLIDLRGMQIYNNSADRYGQSLYIVMKQVIEFCKYGILGKYIKGNYSDTYSNEQELVGIPVDSTTFFNSNSEQIRQQQQTLEPLWRILGILKSAQVIVNVSNPNGKLIFHIEGKRMIPGYLNVKIFEFGNKTQENIDQEQKEMNYQYNKNNLKSLKGTSTQSPNTLKHQTGNQQQISINTTPQIKKKIHNYANEIIYPPEDVSSFPIQVDGKIESEQTATFGMNDLSRLNYKEKVYAVLISNDRNIFTGKDGIDIEEDANAAVQLEVIIEDDVEKEEEEQEEEEIDEQDRKQFPIIYIIVISVMEEPITSLQDCQKVSNPFEGDRQAHIRVTF